MSIEKFYKIDKLSEFPNSKFLIYAIIDPDHGNVVYVGKSCSGLKRPKSHFMPCNLKKKRLLANWIKNRIKQNIKPIIIVLETVTDPIKLSGLEMKYIYEFSNENPLKNLTIGGEGMLGYKRSEESKNNIREKYKGKRPSELCMANSLLARKGKKLTEDQRKNLRLSNLKSIPLLCVTNGKTYLSSRHAKEDFIEIKCHKSIILSAKTGKPIKGLLFKFI